MSVTSTMFAHLYNCVFENSALIIVLYVMFWYNFKNCHNIVEKVYGHSLQIKLQKLFALQPK